MIKTILWDFDGVILDSMKIKGDGFIALFDDFPIEYTKMLEAYHYENGGISRFKKIKYFYNTILNKKISDEEILCLADKFSLIIEKNLFDHENLISSTLDFIEKYHNEYNFHIVSGSEHYELNKICKHFGLDKFFITISGSPTVKETLVSQLLKKYSYIKNETILIGDSINDYNAAVKNDIEFYGFNNLKLKSYGNYIHDFKSFHKRIAV